ncbi:MAG: ABC-type transport auxiliary lipoprotein family protein [Methylococcales bacterium]
MFQRILSIGCIGAILLLGMGACVLSDALRQREAPQVYILDLPRIETVTPAGSGQKPKIAVSVPQAWPGFDSVEIAYTRTTNLIEYYAQSEWVDTPAHMIGPLLVRAMEDSGYFSAVVVPGGSVSTDLRLDTEIVKMQQEFGAASPSIGRVVLRAQLIDLRTVEILATRTFQATAPAVTDNPPSAVAAMNQALSMVFSQILDYCAEFVASTTGKKN